MKRLYGVLALILMITLSAYAQTEEMIVTLTDGTKMVFAVDEIESVSFSQLETLSNSYQISEEIENIGSFLEWQSESGTTFYIYSQEDVKVPSATFAPAFTIWISDDFVWGEDVDLATNSDKVKVSLPAATDEAQVKGTIKLSQKVGMTILSLESFVGDTRVRAAYRGNTTLGYESTQHYSFTDTEGVTFEGELTNLFRYNEPTGGAYYFAAGTAEAGAPIDYRDGDYAFSIRLAASLFNVGTFDLKENADNLELVVYDYKNSKTIYANKYNTTGTLTTRVVGNGVAFHLVAHLTNGMTLDFDFYGIPSAMTETTMADLAPAERLTSNVQVFSADGKNTTHDHPILYAKTKDMASSGYKKFYFVLNEENSLTNSLLTPQLSIHPSICNQGEYQLAEMEANTWSVDFAGIQLSSPDNQYMLCPNNGTLKVDYDASTGEYEIKLYVQNYYPSTFGSGVSGAGEILSLYYKGIPLAY